MAAVWVPKPRREPVARRNSVASMASQIEALAARGMTRQAIQDLTGASVEYVSQVLRYQARTASDHEPEGNCERHLKLIRKANKGKGFPFLDLPAAYRVSL